MAERMIEGDIRNVRQLKSGWQADMVLGVSGSQPRMVTVQVVCKSPEVEKLAGQTARCDTQRKQSKCSPRAWLTDDSGRR